MAAAVLAKAPTYLAASAASSERQLHQPLVRCLISDDSQAGGERDHDVYEKNGKEAEIKNADGEYLMLSGLISALLKQTHWSLGRETKKCLPDVKRLGDRSTQPALRSHEAGHRNIIPGLRATMDDLLHLAGHK